MQMPKLLSLMLFITGVSLVAGLFPVHRPRLDFRAAVDMPAATVKNFLIKIRAASGKKKQEAEIYSALSAMSTLAAGLGEKHVLLRSDLLIEHIIPSSPVLSGILSECLALIRLNQKQKAVELFSGTVCAEYSKDFILLLTSWDDIDPDKLINGIVSLRSAIGEKRMTALKRKAEKLSDIVYLPVVISTLLVFLNFIYIGYYARQREILEQLFY